MNTVDHTILKICIVAVELRHTHTATASFNRIGEKNDNVSMLCEYLSYKMLACAQVRTSQRTFNRCYFRLI